MTIPFFEVVEKLKARFFPSRSAEGPPRVRTLVDKPQSDKLAKTILPNSIRTLTPEPSGAPPVSVLPGGPRMVAMGRTSMPAVRDLPPAVALALEPRVERVLSLDLEDVISELPPGYLKPRESFDTTRRVLLKAAEIEKGMASGSPTISISTLYQQIPEIFLHAVAASDPSLIALPFDKLMNELAKLRVRQDQTVEQVLPQVETPFLQVTLEDTQRFGLPMEPITTAELPPVRMEFATAETIAAAEPEVVAGEKPARPMRNPDPPQELLKSHAPEVLAPSGTNGSETDRRAVRSSPPVPSAPPQSSPSIISAPDRFGTGEPAFPRVPASSGPPVPATPALAPIRIPFSSASPARETGSLAAGGEARPVEPELAAESASPMLTLALRPILQTVPPMQLAGDVTSVPESAIVSFPISLITPQLATGKVVIKPADFYAALPTAFRDLFLPDAVEAPVALALSEVLANLPGEALRVRDDQEIVTEDEVFETPFSAKAQEDAQRFAKREPVVLKGESAKAEDLTPSLKVHEAPKLEPIHRSSNKSEHAQIDWSASVSAPKSQAKEAVAKACSLAGVSSCSVIFADGLSIAGSIPEDLHLEGLSAVAPTLLQKLQKHMLETKLGPLRCVTVYGEKTPVTFFAATDICLTAIHSAGEFTPDTRERLAEITRELSTTYSQPETANVHH